MQEDTYKLRTLNLTKNPMSPKQVSDGLFEFPEGIQNRVRELLTFDTNPSGYTVTDRCYGLCHLVETYWPQEYRDVSPNYRRVLIDAPGFMVGMLEMSLKAIPTNPVYAGIGEFAGDVGENIIYGFLGTKEDPGHWPKQSDPAFWPK